MMLPPGRSRVMATPTGTRMYNPDPGCPTGYTAGMVTEEKKSAAPS